MNSSRRRAVLLILATRIISYETFHLRNDLVGLAGFARISIPQGEAALRVRALCDAIANRGPDAVVIT